ncbi:hypothetical protein GQ53DRAFT_817966 [Thozetella sp. PMI_491]|nr:hypothetical protein GQ53DRAFT_817966 [Thozetella sp. PMI_491]
MRFHTFVALATYGAVILASPIANNPQDGIYTVENKPDGTTELHYKKPLGSRQALPVDFNNTDSPVLWSRGNSVGCDPIWGGGGLDAFSVDRANQALKDHCAHPLTPDEECTTRTTLAVYGNVVAFFCYWRSPAKYNQGSFEWALGEITNYCGAYNAGSISDATSDTRTWSYGFTDWNKRLYCNIPAGTTPHT